MSDVQPTLACPFCGSTTLDGFVAGGITGLICENDHQIDTVQLPVISPEPRREPGQRFPMLKDGRVASDNPFIAIPQEEG